MVVKWAKLPDMVRMLGVGIDYGTNNPTAALMLGAGIDGRLYLVDEWRHDGRVDGRWTDARLVKGLSEWLRGPHLPPGQRDEPLPEWLVVDPSAASLQAEMTEQRVGRLDERRQSRDARYSAGRVPAVDGPAQSVVEVPGVHQRGAGV